jgi:hypothetical protein
MIQVANDDNSYENPIKAITRAAGFVGFVLFWRVRKDIIELAGSLLLGRNLREPLFAKPYL